MAFFPHLILSCAIALSSVAATAQDAFPARPVRLVVPLPPGGSNYLLARYVAQRLGESWGQPVLVENRPGANTIIGAEQVVKAPGDGHTLLIGATSTYTINPLIYPKLSYDPVRDLTPVTMIGDHALIIVVNPSVPANSLRELIDLARRQPGKLDYGTPAVSFQVVIEDFALLAGVKAHHIPFKGSVHMLTSLLGGDLQFLFIDPPPALPHVRTGRLRALAVTSANRVPYLPDVPTVSEAAVPGYSAMFWVGLFAPSSTPRPIVSQVQQEVSRIVRSAAGQERFSTLGISPVGNTPDEFLSYLKAESIRYAPVIRATGIRAE